MRFLKSLAAVLFVCFLSSCVVDNSDAGYARPIYYGPGIGLGSVIAVVVSWSRNKSILWAIIHGILGWLYVIYAALVKKS